MAYPKNYPDLSQGGIKFATHISPLLNFIFIRLSGFYLFGHLVSVLWTCLICTAIHLRRPLEFVSFCKINGNNSGIVLNRRQTVKIEQL